MSIYMKIRPVGDELFHADRRTDMTKLIVAFRNFASAPKKETKTVEDQKYANNDWRQSVTPQPIRRINKNSYTTLTFRHRASSI